jgi:hypothetical protein
MAGARDQKTNWNAGETIMWVRTRDYDRVADLWDASEFESISLAWFARDLLPKIPVRMTSGGSVVVGEASSPVPSEPELVTIPDPPVTTPPQPDQAMIVAWALAVAAVHHQRGPSASIDLPLDRILRELMKKVHTRRIQMTLRKGAARGPVSTEQAKDLEFHSPRIRSRRSSSGLKSTKKRSEPRRGSRGQM